MTTIKATFDHGNLLLQEPLPATEGRFSALVIIADDPESGGHFPHEKLVPQDFTAEEEFEAIGLRDYFSDPIDARVNWEKFFHLGEGQG